MNCDDTILFYSINYREIILMQEYFKPRPKFHNSDLKF